MIGEREHPSVTVRDARPSVHGILLPLKAETLQQILPHRGSFALLDRVETIEPGQSATGTHLVARNDPILEQHFPGRPILPGVLLIEALGQLSGIVLWSRPVELPEDGDVPAQEAVLGVLAGVKKFRLTRLVVPGDVVQMRARLVGHFGATFEFEVTASVDREKAASGALQVALRAP